VCPGWSCWTNRRSCNLRWVNGYARCGKPCMKNSITGHNGVQFERPSCGSTILRGWAGYFHYRNSTEVMTHMTHYARDRFRRWLWREHDPTRGLLIAK
jgi:Group II intron, maturase-specific domain